ncbi:MAG: HAD hydrolase-like protein [Deltaproteobacteria bacterium]|nr:HAD hydrolase-like protein [Deltaproteobacteria bacterium]
MVANKLTLLWDLDGTLIDSRRGVHACIIAALASLDLPRPSDEALRLCIGPPLVDSFRRMHPQLSEQRVLDLLDSYRRCYRAKGLAQAEVLAGVPSALEQLAAAGYRQLVATSKPRVFAVKTLAHFALLDRFTAVYGPALDGALNDKGELLAVLLDEQQLDPSECLMIGDTSFDLTAAQQNGIRFVGVSWGTCSAAELRQAGAQRVFDRPDDLVRDLL